MIVHTMPFTILLSRVTCRLIPPSEGPLRKVSLRDDGAPARAGAVLRAVHAMTSRQVAGGTVDEVSTFPPGLWRIARDPGSAFGSAHEFVTHLAGPLWLVQVDV